jgi:trehalose 6-phosphate synthase/trehalose 6-phosphate phosphatase
MQARPLAGIPGILRAIVDAGTTVAILSGRPVREVLELIGDLGITVVGSHGHELRYPDGSVTAVDPEPVQREGLDRARDLVVLPEGMADRVESKIASVALHTRGLCEEDASVLIDKALALWHPLAAAHRLEVRHFDGGVELRSRGWHKGSALLQVLVAQPVDAFCVYVGDDETDEDAFRALRDRGVALRVGRCLSDSAAHGCLADCAAVRAFLLAWDRVTGGKPL